MNKNYVEALMDSAVMISDDEIKALASLSNKQEGEIFEIIEKGNYQLLISYDGKSQQVLIASNNKENYVESSRDFFKKFAKYGGNITFDEIFIKKDPAYLLN